MPELPEVETTRRGLEPAMAGQRFVRVDKRRPDLRFPFPQNFEQRLIGTTVLSVDRRAKYIIARLSSDESLIMHLGMSGSFTVLPPASSIHELRLHDHVVFEFSNGFTIIYNDPRRFGFMDIAATHALEESRHFVGMGLEPLNNRLCGAEVLKLFGTRKTPLKSALLDQRLIAGLGNIYVCEALYRSGLHPERKAHTLKEAEAESLAFAIRDVLQEALASGGSTLRNYAKTDGTLGYFQHRFRVYDREGEPCPTPDCTAHITRIVQSGRSTFLCPHCQKV